MEFKWDDEKAETNVTKHGVSFSEAEEAFYDPYFISYPDDEHSWAEQRMKLVGATRKQLLLVIYVEIREDFFRIISAREPNKYEKRLYYEHREDW